MFGFKRMSLQLALVFSLGGAIGIVVKGARVRLDEITVHDGAEVGPVVSAENVLVTHLPEDVQDYIAALERGNESLWGRFRVIVMHRKALARERCSERRSGNRVAVHKALCSYGSFLRLEKPGDSPNNVDGGTPANVGDYDLFCQWPTINYDEGGIRNTQPSSVVLMEVVNGGLDGCGRGSGAGIRSNHGVLSRLLVSGSLSSITGLGLCQGSASNIDSVLGSIGGLSHLLKLSPVDQSDEAIHQQGEDAEPNKPSFSTPYLLLQSQCYGFILAGCLLSGTGWYVLITRRLQWGVNRRLGFWFPLNVLAFVIYWHSGSILFGVMLP